MNYKEDDYMNKGYENAKKDCMEIISKERVSLNDSRTFGEIKRDINRKIKGLKCFGDWQV